MSPGLRVRLRGGAVVGWKERPDGRCDAELLRLAGDGYGLGADEVGPQCIDVDDGAVERMVDRLAGDGELFALSENSWCWASGRIADIGIGVVARRVR